MLLTDDVGGSSPSSPTKTFTKKLIRRRLSRVGSDLKNLPMDSKWSANGPRIGMSRVDCDLDFAPRRCEVANPVSIPG
jgi:hypothetical protein